MFGKTKFVLFAAIVLGTAFPASAVTKHHPDARVHPAIQQMIPATIRSSCSPTHAPLCSNICTGPGPCAPPDGW